MIPPRTQGAPRRTLKPPFIWLVLALLIEKPSYGYELRERCQTRFGPLLTLGDTRAYEALDILREHHLAEQIEAPASTKPAPTRRRQQQARRYYKATSIGVEKLHQWLASPATIDDANTDLYTRIAAAGIVGADALHTVIANHQAACEQARNDLPATRADPPKRDSIQTAKWLIDTHTHTQLEAQTTWTSRARRHLDVRNNPNQS